MKLINKKLKKEKDLLKFYSLWKFKCNPLGNNINNKLKNSKKPFIIFKYYNN